MASYRHLARIAVVQTIFAHEFHGDDAEEMLKYVLKEFTEKVKDPDFPMGILNLLTKNKEKIRKLISKNAPEWPIDKIAAVDRAILELGVAEIIYSDSVPPVVAINEAIEIAKEYGDYNSPKFINGVLSAVMNSECKGMNVKKCRKEQ